MSALTGQPGGEGLDIDFRKTRIGRDDCHIPTPPSEELNEQVAFVLYAQGVVLKEGQQTSVEVCGVQTVTLEAVLQPS